MVRFVHSTLLTLRLWDFIEYVVVVVVLICKNYGYLVGNVVWHVVLQGLEWQKDGVNWLVALVHRAASIPCSLFSFQIMYLANL